jgi:hypothetical protein
MCDPIPLIYILLFLSTMAYRPPTNKYSTPESSRPQLQKPWAPTKVEKKELTGQDFPSLTSVLGKPVSKSNSSTSLSSSTSNASNTSKGPTLAERMKIKLAEEEAERKRQEEEDRRKEEETEAERLLRNSLNNVVSFSQISRRVAEQREKNHSYDYNEYPDHPGDYADDYDSDQEF